jgi:hypothetical protein
VARLHAVIALPPVGRADVAALLVEAERVEHARRLGNAPAQREIVDHRMAHHALTVDEKQTAQGNLSLVEVL